MNPKFTLLHLIALITFHKLQSQEPKTIDYHTHIFSEALLQNLRDQGFSLARSNYEVTCTD